MATQPHNQSKTAQPCDFSELTKNPIYGYPDPVGECHQQNAKFWDSYSHVWRQTRHDDAAGFFMPVDFAHCGLMPGMRGIQDGVNRNKRVVLQTDDRITQQLLPNPKTLFGAIHMTATTTGAPAHHPLARLPHIPFAPAPRKCKTPDTLVFKQSRTGMIAYRYAVPVAWIVEGYHAGKVGDDHTTISFVDVAYHRQTRNGINLETFDCESLEQAQHALRAIFERGTDAGGFSTGVGYAASTERDAA